MTSVIVDTNVGLVANSRSNADLSCQRKCIERLLQITTVGTLLLDSLGLILHEYLKQKPYGFPQEFGDLFFIWANDNQANPAQCRMIEITIVGGATVDWHVHSHDPDLEEFPLDDGLERFDRQDRKFVAVSIASKEQPMIINAVDSDWHEFEAALSKVGVAVDFICPRTVRGKKLVSS
jgi:hypothetical protein